jgi:hypothetical protein
MVPGKGPMGDAVARIAESRYAAGLYPVQSMHTLLLYQHDYAGPEDEQLRLDCEDGELVVRYRAGTTPDPRFALRPPPGIWEKRGTDVIALLERAFHHLRWFVEYKSASPMHRGPAV